MMQGKLFNSTEGPSNLGCTSGVLGFNSNMSFMKTAQLMKPMSSGSYVDQMYSAWKSDPTSVDGSWQTHFSSIEGTGS